MIGAKKWIQKWFVHHKARRKAPTTINDLTLNDVTDYNEIEIRWRSGVEVNANWKLSDV